MSVNGGLKGKLFVVTILFLVSLAQVRSALSSMSELDDHVEANFYVQVAALKAPDNALLAIQQVSQMGYAACSWQRDGWHLVTTGPFIGWQGARQAMDALSTLYPDSFVVDVGQHYVCQHGLAVTESDGYEAQESDQKVTKVPMQDTTAWQAVAGTPLFAALESYRRHFAYKRIVYDVEGLQRFSQDVVVKQDMQLAQDVRGLQAMVNVAFSDGELYVYEARDDEMQTLLLTDYPVANWASLQVTDIKAGSLMDNALSLARLYGWHVPEHGWQLDVDYRVRFDFPIVHAGIEQGFAKLFKRFPVQAQLVSNTRQVVFVGRQLTVLD